MSEVQHQFFWTEKPANDNIVYDLPDDFKSYVKKEDLHCLRREPTFGVPKWIFWSPEDDQRKRPPPPATSSQIIDLAFETRLANSNVTEKIKSLLQELRLEEEILVQFWKVNEIGGRRLLTTRDQPFYLSFRNEIALCSYRLMSLDYEFYADGGESEEDLGLVGRVFRHQRLESTPNVQYYSSKEYPQRDLTMLRNIKKSLALPVFEPSGQCCVGVLELVMPRVFLLCSFLTCYIYSKIERVGLKCLETCNHMHSQMMDKGKACEDALVEIKKVLEVLCRTHRLPLAQTWVPCRICSALVFGSHYILDKKKFLFSDACATHHLRLGQGVVGRSFSTHNSVFCKDITQFSITEYPLAHYAHECGLTGCFAICLQSSYTEDEVFVIELFLPPSKTEGGNPRDILVSLLATMRQNYKSFKVAFGEEKGEDLSIELVDFSKDGKLGSFQIPHSAIFSDGPKPSENEGQMVWLDSSDQKFMEMDSIHTGNNAVTTTEKSNAALTSSQQKCIINPSQGQHRKAGIPMSVEDIEQHSGMKLEDAVESLGVSQSTQKLACREFQIPPQPSQKRNKTNHSLSNKSLQDAVKKQIQGCSQPPISDPFLKQEMPIAAGTKPHIKAVQDTSDVTIKAKYGEDFIKFQLPMPAGMVEFQQEVEKRLKLGGGTYSVKYEDVDNGWIEIACDEVLQACISKSRSRGCDTVRMSLQPVN